MYMYVYIYIYIHTHVLSLFIGWSNNEFNSLHIIVSLDTRQTTACAAEQRLTCCDCLKRRLFKRLCLK